MSTSNGEGRKMKEENINAYNFNPKMMEQLGMVTPNNLFYFMIQNPEIVPDGFRKRFWKNARDFVFLGAVCGVGGIASNIVLSRTVPKLLSLPSFVRIPLRFIIFGLPFLAASQAL